MRLTQNADTLGLTQPLYTAGGPPVNQATGDVNTGETDLSYGWAYPFEDFYIGNGVDNNGYGVILPSHVYSTPGVFELKKPYDNVKGIVE